MPGPNDVQLNPPASWEEFEDICADLFMREWAIPTSCVMAEMANPRMASIFT
jgi:hypothetical protein